jgi:hypothetical protein
MNDEGIGLFRAKLVLPDWHQVRRRKEEWKNCRMADRVRTGVTLVMTDLSGCLRWFSSVEKPVFTEVNRGKSR